MIDYKNFMEQATQALTGEMSVLSERSWKTEKFGIEIHAIIVKWTNSEGHKLFCLFRSTLEDPNKMELVTPQKPAYSKLGYQTLQGAENARRSFVFCRTWRWDHKKEQEDLKIQQKMEIESLKKKAAKAGLLDIEVEQDNDKVCVNKAQLIKLLDYKKKSA
jgi:hypothetical protein